jgi:ABC-type multidrug transport system fused ATPase/permease subunit
MDLQEVWKKLNEDKLSKTTTQVSLLSNFKSKHPVQKLIVALQVTLRFNIAFGILFFALIFFYSYWLLQILLGLIVIAYVWFYIHNKSIYKKLKQEWENTLSGNVQHALQSIHNIVTNSIRLQERAAIFIYPISISAGYLIGLQSGSGTSNLEAFFLRKEILLVLLGTIVIFTPLCYYLSRWMYKVSFEVYLKQLKNLLENLNKVE